MTDRANETIKQPFTAFNFEVEINVPGVTTDRLCAAAFSECDGLEMTMEIKTIREGGNNNAQIRMLGPMSYGQITLKRGMTDSFDLWDWFNKLVQAPSVALRESLRGEVTVVLNAADGVTERARFALSRCLPVKLKAPSLNAKDGMIAIEEMQLVYETMTREKPK